MSTVHTPVRLSLRAEFAAYKQGSEEAFAAVVQQKQDLEEDVHQFERSMAAQNACIVKMRAQRNELIAELELARHLLSQAAGKQSRLRAIQRIDAVITKAKGGAA